MSAEALMTTTTEEPISVVLVEDDDRLAKLTARYLESHGVKVTVIGDGREAVSQIVQSRPDVVLLDLMLPGKSGLDVCRELRSRSDVPVLMVTARGEEADRVVGLEGGADDYIAKPFSSRELLARVRAHARRARGAAGPAKKTMQVGRISIDVDAIDVDAIEHALYVLPTCFRSSRAPAASDRALTARDLHAGICVDRARRSAEPEHAPRSGSVAW